MPRRLLRPDAVGADAEGHAALHDVRAPQVDFVDFARRADFVYHVNFKLVG